MTLMGIDDAADGMVIISESVIIIRAGNVAGNDDEVTRRTTFPANEFN